MYVLIIAINSTITFYRKEDIERSNQMFTMNN